MKLRRLASLIDGTAAVARATARAMEAFDKTRRSHTGTVILLVSAGVALGALATSPELREKLRSWLRAGAAVDDAAVPFANGAVHDGAVAEYVASG